MTLEIGQVLKDRYRIEEVLGEGGMGTVYKAYDLLLDRPRAIKELYPDPMADEAKLHAARQQFEQEAKALKKLRHRGLPNFSDAFSVDEFDYLVMDYVEGQSLADILAGKQRPTEPLAYEWLSQIIDVLEYCHQNNVIHRDIKPANLILTPEQRIVLVDFGLVKMVDPHNPKTATIVRGLGTPQYTPLEQYDSHRGHTDARSDIYSLGATFYHLLTGRPPQPVSQRILNPATQAPLQQVNAKISPWMAQFVQRAMAIRPEDRFQDTKEMRRELDTRLFKLKSPPTAARTAAHRALQNPSHTTLIGRPPVLGQTGATSYRSPTGQTVAMGRTATHRQSTTAKRNGATKPASVDGLAGSNTGTSKHAKPSPDSLTARPQSPKTQPRSLTTTGFTPEDAEAFRQSMKQLAPMAVPVSVVFVLAVVVSIVFASGSSLVTAAVIAPLILSAWAYHKLRSGRNKRPPKF
jgi:serine/threonine-protein kinase